MRKFVPVIIALFLVMSLTGCGIMPVKPQTPETIYDQAMGWWVDTEQNFKRVYVASEPADQAAMLPFAEALLDVKHVLNLWNLYLEGGQATGMYSQSFKDKKNDLIMMIVNGYKEVK